MQAKAGNNHDPLEPVKRKVAYEALKYVRDGMVIGLGTGSTSKHFITGLGELVASKGWHVECVPTSFDSKHLAFKSGLHVVELDAVDHIDYAVDGADLVNTKLQSIKGAGGALVREKVVAYEAKDFTIIIDDSKYRELSGIVPIEVTPFAYSTVKRKLRHDGIEALARTGTGKFGPLISDNGNYILDARMEVSDAAKMELYLDAIPGVVDCGIFTKCTRVIMGNKSGIKILGSQ
ncbi:MAG: ribose-5-phosphate isomerase RpiA [Candidatus Micrarchaeia archaeon]